MFDDEHALPEEVDGTGFIAQFPDGRFKGSDAPAGDAEDIEEFVPKGLRFRFFPDGGTPAEGEFHSAIADLFLA
jgi:hypothetical protein